MKRLTLLVCGLILAGCGGGGGSSPTASQPVVSTPAPTVTASFSKPTANVGTPVALTWSSTNSTSCTASGAWSGVQLLSGSLTVTPAVGGQAKYTLTCSGAGGSAVKDVTLITPIPVQASSYLNKTMIKLDDPTIPTAYSLGMEKSIGGNYYAHFEPKTIAFADFLQIGEPVVFVSQAGLSVSQKNKGGYADLPARIAFMRKVNNGWVDVTDKLLPNDADRYVCRGPADPLVADFNNDGKPDLFLSCTGGDVDADVWVTLNDIQKNERLSEFQYIFLSQPDGKYKVSKTTEKLYGHGATAGDLNGDGLIDVIVTDPRWGVNESLVAFINQGGGVFKPDYTRFDVINKAIYTIELVDLGRGVLDLVIGATPSQPEFITSMPNVIIRNSGGYFKAPYDVLPNMISRKSGKPYGLFLGLLVSNGNLYLGRIGNDYTDFAIQKINLSDLSSTVVWEKTTPFSDAPNGNLDYGNPTNLYKLSNGDIVPMMPCVFSRTDVKFATSICGIKVQ